MKSDPLTRGHISNADWNVPEFDYIAFRTQRSKYCLVIPVINEGERLTAQLKIMAELGHMNLVDVIIADGGSTDGSTTPAALSQLGVAALLVKRGAGKLSAQLRTAYAWALDREYEGIITIDGNGKDSVDTVPRFIDALESGVDYAQASRFIQGGKGINTPPIRWLAVRLIHAPMLSLAAGKWLTDTTQGFRGYSARYLLHPDVQPFRSVFSSYELLAYLTVRASQLGFTVTEIPTCREYPATGPIPTKISSISGVFELMGTLLATVARRFHPKH